VDDLSSLLTASGEWLLRLLPAAPAAGSEERAHLAVTLGIVVWLLALLGVGALWRLQPKASRDRRSAQLRRADARLVGGRDGLLAWLRPLVAPWTARQVFGAVWRVELAHLLVYALLPALWVGGNLAWFAVTIPLRVASFSESTRGWYDGSLDHLHLTRCWIVAAPCPGPQVDERLGALVVQLPGCPAGASCLPPAVAPVERSGWRWRLLWASLALTWIVLWRNALRSPASAVGPHTTTGSGSSRMPKRP